MGLQPTATVPGILDEPSWLREWQEGDSSGADRWKNGTRMVPTENFEGGQSEVVPSAFSWISVFRPRK